MKASRLRLGKAAVSSAAVAAFGLSIFTPALSAQNVTPPPGATVETINIKGPGGGLRFDGPATAPSGSYLEIVNKTKASQVGPHSFSLVSKGSIPKTKHARKACFTPNHICKAIAGWHGKSGNLAPAGAEGWDTPGKLGKKGDSWFTGHKPNASVTQQLTADTSAGPVTLYYMCAVHAFMHGSITVTPPTP